MEVKKTVIIFTVFLLFVSSFLIGGGKEGIHWLNHPERAFKLAKEKGAPIFIDFWASWCGPCKRMERDVWPDEQLIKLSKHFVFLSVDADLRRGINSKYNVRVLPTLVITDSAGNVLNHFEGYKSAKYLIDVMKVIPKDFSKAHKWLEVLKKDKKNTDALIEVANFYAAQRCCDTSNLYFKRALKTKKAKNNPEIQEKIMLSMGMNCLRMGHNKNACKIFQKACKKFPKGDHLDKILFGLITTHLRSGKLKDAEKNFSRLRELYPGSRVVKMAALSIERQKKQ